MAKAAQLFPVGARVTARYVGYSGWYEAVVDEIKGDGTLLISWDQGWSDNRVKTVAQLRRL